MLPFDRQLRGFFDGLLVHCLDSHLDSNATAGVPQRQPRGTLLVRPRTDPGPRGSLAGQSESDSTLDSGGLHLLCNAGIVATILQWIQTSLDIVL